MRIFPTGKESNNFTAEVVIRNEDILEIEVGKGLAKGLIDAKNLKYK
jgi:hypothetical protein